MTGLYSDGLPSCSRVPFESTGSDVREVPIDKPLKLVPNSDSPTTPVSEPNHVGRRVVTGKVEGTNGLLHGLRGTVGKTGVKGVSTRSTGLQESDLFLAPGLKTRPETPTSSGVETPETPTL